MAETKEFSILVVDDEELIRKNLGKYLQRRGFQVYLAQDGTEAFDLIQKQKMDFIVSDVRMPNGDGLQLLENIQTKLGGEPPLIFVTGYSAASTQDALRLGAKEVFQKPVDRKVLYAKILELLDIQE